MKVRKKLFLIFGPIVCALMILLFVFSLPFKINFISKPRVYEASLSQSTNVFKGTQLKKRALSSNYVPFFGSSEWSRIDSFHPAVLAKKFTEIIDHFFWEGAARNPYHNFGACKV